MTKKSTLTLRFLLFHLYFILTSIVSVLTVPSICLAQVSPPAGLMTFVDLVNSADNMDDLIKNATEKIKSYPGQYGLFREIQDSPASPMEPQIVFRTGDLWIGTGHGFFDVIITPSDNQEWLWFQVQEKNGRLVVNDNITPKKLAKMHLDPLLKKNRDYAKTNCQSCHKDRLLLEIKNQPRTFFPSFQMAFATTQDKKAFDKSQQLIHKQFISKEENTNDPRYQWLFDLGYTDTPRNLGIQEGYVQGIIEENSKKAITNILNQPEVEKYSKSLLAAALDRKDFLTFLAEVAKEEINDLEEEYQKKLTAQGMNTLRFIKRRNQELRKQVQKDLKDSPLFQEMSDSPILLDAIDIVNIGPAIFSMLVSKSEYQILSDKEKMSALTMEQLIVSSEKEISEILNSDQNGANVRVKLDMTLERMMNSKIATRNLISSSIVPSYEALTSKGNSIQELAMRLSSIYDKELLSKLSEMSSNDFGFYSQMGIGKRKYFRTYARDKLMKRKRPVFILENKLSVGGKMVLTNFSHKGGFYLAEIPSESIETASLMTKKTPGGSSAILKFSTYSDRPIKLIAKVSKFSGAISPLDEPIEIQDVVISNEASWGGILNPKYSFWGSFFKGHFFNVIRVMSLEKKRAENMDEHKFKESPLLIPSKVAQKMFEKGVHESARWGTYPRHNPICRNCASKTSEIIFSAIPKGDERLSWTHRSGLNPNRYEGGSLEKILLRAGLLKDSSTSCKITIDAG